MPVEYFGHQRIREALTRSLPSVSVFSGPSSVGKRELAENLRFIHGVKSEDVLRINRLTMDNARKIVSFSSHKPKGEIRLVIVEFSTEHPITRGATDALLKSLEEPHDTKFILIANMTLPTTVLSRAEVFHFGLLSGDNVRDILIQKKGYPEEKAAHLASHSQGQVSRALSYDDRMSRKPLVLEVLAAVAVRNLVELEALTPRWTEDHTELLVEWCMESVSGRYNVFSPNEVGISGWKLPLNILTQLQSRPRPRLVIRAALAKVISTV